MRKIAAAVDQRGYPGLLNLSAQRHWTLFLSDFELAAADKNRIHQQLAGSPTRPIFMAMDRDVEQVKGALIRFGVDLESDYVSIQGIVFQHDNVLMIDDLYTSIPRRDFARLELPLPECGFQPSFASRMLRVVAEADYLEQDRICERFFQLLAQRKPYRVTVTANGCRLEVRDSEPWFDIAGRLEDAEHRILPGGEVSYTGTRVDGEFLVDGGLLPLPEHPHAAKDASRLALLSGELGRNPMRVRIRAGRAVDVRGRGRAPGVLSSLFEKDDRYRNVTEVGISFNGACGRFIHHWPAASNEAHPGVHIGLGGDPIPKDEVPGEPLVHIDCMAANCQVFVNGHPFLRASS